MAATVACDTGDSATPTGVGDPHCPPRRVDDDDRHAVGEDGHERYVRRVRRQRVSVGQRLSHQRASAALGRAYLLHDRPVHLSREDEVGRGDTDAVAPPGAGGDHVRCGGTTRERQIAVQAWSIAGRNAVAQPGDIGEQPERHCLSTLVQQGTALGRRTRHNIPS